MSLLTVRIPVPANTPLDGSVLAFVSKDDRPRVAAPARVRSLRVVSTEASEAAPFLRSLALEAAAGSLAADPVDLGPQAPAAPSRQNIVDWGVGERTRLGGAADWVVKSSRVAPLTGAVITLLFTLDEEAAAPQPVQ